MFCGLGIVMLGMGKMSGAVMFAPHDELYSPFQGFFRVCYMLYC